MWLLSKTKVYLSSRLRENRLEMNTLPPVAKHIPTRKQAIRIGWLPYFPASDKSILLVGIPVFLLASCLSWHNKRISIGWLAMFINLKHEWHMLVGVCGNYVEVRFEQVRHKDIFPGFALMQRS